MALTVYVIHHSNNAYWPYTIVDVMDNEAELNRTYRSVVAIYYRVPEEIVSSLSLQIIKRDKKRHGILP